jgi:hypothetical protein
MQPMKRQLPWVDEGGGIDEYEYERGRPGKQPALMIADASSSSSSSNNNNNHLGVYSFGQEFSFTVVGL